MKIIEKRYWYFLLSLLVMLPGLVGLALWGLPLAIDFTGGSKLELRMPAATELVATRTILHTVLDWVDAEKRPGWLGI